MTRKQKRSKNTHRYVGLKFVALAIVALLQRQNTLVHAEIIVLPVHHIHAWFRAIVENVQSDEPKKFCGRTRYSLEGDSHQTLMINEMTNKEVLIEATLNKTPTQPIRHRSRSIVRQTNVDGYAGHLRSVDLRTLASDQRDVARCEIESNLGVDDGS